MAENAQIIRKVDLHVHSHYSEMEEGVLKRIIQSESYTTPLEIYKIARKRDMDFVTITDHNSIRGVSEIAHLPDVFMSEEATVKFPEDNFPIHVVVLNVNEAQHQQVQDLKGNIYELVQYLTSADILNFVAHPFSPVEGELKREHWEKMLLLFDIFEVRNGTEREKDNQLLEKISSGLAREKIEELANRYNIAPLTCNSWKKSMVGGSDDHGGLYIGKTYTLGEGPGLETFLKSIKLGNCIPQGRNGTYFTIGHSIYATGYKFYREKLKKKKRGRWLGFVDKIVSDERKGRILEKLLIRNGRYRMSFVPKNFLLFYFIKKFSKKMPFLSVLTAISKLNKNLASYVTLSPYLFGFVYQNKGKKFMREVKVDYLNQRDPLKTALFTDLGQEHANFRSMFETAYVSSSGEKIEVLGCTRKKSIQQAGWKLFHSKVDFLFPLFPEINFYVPPLMDVVIYCEQKEFTLAHVLTPGPMGIVGIIVAKILKLPIIGTYHRDFLIESSLYSANDKGFKNIIRPYFDWFYKQMDKILVSSEKHLVELVAKDIPEHKIQIISNLAGSSPNPSTFTFTGNLQSMFQNEVLDQLWQIYRETHTESIRV